MKIRDCFDNKLNVYSNTDLQLYVLLAKSFCKFSEIPQEILQKN